MAKSSKGLEALEKLLANPDKVLDLVARSLAEESVNLIKDGFRTETDPYGEKWQPKQLADGRKTLSGKTSRLKTGWKVTRMNGREVVVSPSVEYAEYHQNPGERKRASSADVYRRSIEGGFSRRQISRARSFTENTIGPAQLARPRRMMVPDDGKGLPPKWERELNSAAVDAFAVVFGGDGRRVSALRKLIGTDALVGFKVG